MKNKFFSHFLCFSLLFISFNSFAEHEPLTWGEVDEQYLKMTEYEPDPDASILILGDYCEVLEKM